MYSKCLKLKVFQIEFFFYLKCLLLHSETFFGVGPKSIHEIVRVTFIYKHSLKPILYNILIMLCVKQFNGVEFFTCVSVQKIQALETFGISGILIIEAQPSTERELGNPQMARNLALH